MTEPAPSVDVVALLRSRSYLSLLVIVAILGAPIAAIAYWFLYAVADMQKWIFNPEYLPKALGFDGTPNWWPIPLVALAGLLVGLTVQVLPGRGGHCPADGFHTGGTPVVAYLPGITLAAFAGLSLGAVIGPEAPLIAIGGGVAAGAVRAIRKNAPEQSVTVVGVAGSFAAVSTLLGSPLTGAFLLMEASGLGGPMMGLVLVPGLLAAGIGALTFVGFESWTGHGSVSLAIPNLPPAPHPDIAELAWAVGIGVAAVFVGAAIRWLGLYVKNIAEPRIAKVAPFVGLGVGLLAFGYTEWTSKPFSDVLFSGQSSLPMLLTDSAQYSAGALTLLVLFKGLAYGLSLGAFRGGPTFPAMFVGAAGGLALSHLPGLPSVTGAGVGIGAMTCVMLGLPLTSVLLVTLFLGTDTINIMPLVIIAVVVAYVGRAHFAPTPKQRAAATPASSATPAASVDPQ